MPSPYDWLRQDCGLQGDSRTLFDLARRLEDTGDLHTAATAYDRAFGLDESNDEIGERRAWLLDQLAVTEHGIRFVYIPAGTFLMGSETGEPDERPVHPVELGHYWLAETPISWATYCQLAGWQAPPDGLPEGFDWQKVQKGDHLASVPGANKVRLQYCENETTRACDWHAHVPRMEWKRGDGRITTSREMFGEVPRENPEAPWGYDQKPLIAISWEGIEFLCGKISSAAVSYRLPTEAEWEKGARGGLINQPFPWGSEPPNPGNCDFDRFDNFAIQPMRRFSPNGYLLYAISGCVWEYVSDWYDAGYYAESPRLNPTGPAEGIERVFRGGAWSDCGAVQAVSYRSSRPSDRWCSPNIGFRLCRVATMRVETN